MKKLNTKGFTLIELLAVITIMGILMLVAIPSVSRTIENSRRDTFASNAKGYINAVRNAFIADNISCQTTPGSTTFTPASALPAGKFYFVIATASGTTSTGTGEYSTTYATSTLDLMESGGKSSFGNTDLYGYVMIEKKVTAGSATTPSKTNFEYSILLADSGKHGIASVSTVGGVTTQAPIAENKITRASVALSDINAPSLSGLNLCKVS